MRATRRYKVKHKACGARKRVFFSNSTELGLEGRVHWHEDSATEMGMVT